MTLITSHLTGTVSPRRDAGPGYLETKAAPPGGASSFRRARATRRRKRAERCLALNSGMNSGMNSAPTVPAGAGMGKSPARRVRIVRPAPDPVGPTPETARKLRPDPLRRLEQTGGLTPPQIRAAHQIRRSFRLITTDAAVRVTRYSDVVVQTGRRPAAVDREFEIRLQDRYSDWVERMTAARLAVGPVLDVVVEELSLAVTDRKWRRRKGWARDHLCRALDLYLRPGSPPAGPEAPTP